LKDEFVFASLIDIDKKLDDALVYMGGERSAFYLTLNETTDNFEDYTKSLIDNQKITLVSDLFTDVDIYRWCDFAVTSTKSFRNIKSSTGNYRLSKEKHHTFLTSGSVFYPSGHSNRDEIINSIRKPNLNQIGYNIVI
jgi:hypothetical protein